MGSDAPVPRQTVNWQPDLISSNTDRISSLESMQMVLKASRNPSQTQRAESFAEPVLSSRGLSGAFGNDALEREVVPWVRMFPIKQLRVQPAHDPPDLTAEPNHLLALPQPQSVRAVDDLFIDPERPVA